MEGLELNPSFWRGKRVFITGHTGFKGSWLTHWLKRTGANITGFALAPPTEPNLFHAANIADGIMSIQGDVRDAEVFFAALRNARAEIVIHMAAQSLVRASYDDPIGTYATNIMGTVHLLDAVRRTAGVRVVIVITSDKCYENREWIWPYRENEPMGGNDPYSSSKGCAELVTSAYRRSFFRNNDAARIASVRAGNVIGGGDWAQDRLVPDLLRAFHAGQRARIRNPHATRPWQFVVDALAGYLALAEALWDDAAFADGWNFGPYDSDVRPVHWLADSLVESWGGGASWGSDTGDNSPEAFTLKLDSSRARSRLGWCPRISLQAAIDFIVEFHKELDAGAGAATLLDRQLEAFEAMS